MSDKPLNLYLVTVRPKADASECSEALIEAKNLASAQSFVASQTITARKIGAAEALALYAKGLRPIRAQNVAAGQDALPLTPAGENSTPAPGTPEGDGYLAGIDAVSAAREERARADAEADKACGVDDADTPL